jgi:predicted RNA binding protein YcfA (HicA-like mRNA interferase family)
MKGIDLVKKLEKAGWKVDRITGSHHNYAKPPPTLNRRFLFLFMAHEMCPKALLKNLKAVWIKEKERFNWLWCHNEECYFCLPRNI